MRLRSLSPPPLHLKLQIPAVHCLLKKPFFHEWGRDGVGGGGGGGGD